MPLAVKSKRFGQTTHPNLYFRDGVLSIPGYTFEQALAWADTGSMTQLAEGNSLKDGSRVLAKIAPAHSNGRMCLEREAHILENMSKSAEASTATLRFIDFFSIARPNGDCVVLLVSHPGENQLAKYFPSSKVNDLLLADLPPRLRPSSSHGDVFMVSVDDAPLLEHEPCDTMDLASFLEFAIQATHCLQMIHQLGIVHREVRPNAFHLNAHSGRVRLVHFGNRAVSLEQFGGPTELVFQADVLGETARCKVKEALCYLAPEQTGSWDVNTDDHRTDLYALGVMLWTILVGRGVLPFEGTPMEVLYYIAQKRPNPVHEVRRDVPQVLAAIIDKLLSKGSDQRYQSAHGVKADLLECQRRLLTSVHSGMDNDISELIPSFEIARDDRYMQFTIPSTLYGREKEQETIRNVIRQTMTSYSRHHGASHGLIIAGSGSSPNQSPSHSHEAANSVNADEQDDNMSSRSEGSQTQPVTPVTSMPEVASPRYLPVRRSPSVEQSGVTPSSMASPSADGLRRAALVANKTRIARVHSVILHGAAGAGKSSLILGNQTRWRAHGLWGQAKFQRVENTPFAVVMSCLSSVLRQLMVFEADLQRFVNSLSQQLGPQLQNIPLLYQGAPELRYILNLYSIEIDSPKEALSTIELRARFQSLVVDVFSVLAETRLFALFLDDLHEADESSLDLIHTLANSRSRMIIFTTLRPEDTFFKRAQTIFSSKTRTTWVDVDALSYSAVLSIVSKALHRSKEECSPLARLVHGISHGNAFSARNFLGTLQRQHLITYSWEKNNWFYDIQAVENSLVEQKTSGDPTDPDFLLSHLRKLPDEARKYLIWASLFGSAFKVAEVNLMLDWEDSSGSSSEDETEDWSMPKVLSAMRSSSHNGGRQSMKGLQMAISEGWLVQRARDMCSFAHDRYRQAVEAHAATLPSQVLGKMSFRIILMMLSESKPDVHRVAEHAKRCLPLLRDHEKREELSELLSDAAESAWARGAHEIALDNYVNVRALLDPKAWELQPERTTGLFMKLAELYSWKALYEESDALIAEALLHAQVLDEKALLLRLRSRNHWVTNSFGAAVEDALSALRLLGVDLKSHPSERQSNILFDQVKNQILAVGFESILATPVVTDSRAGLVSNLLVEAATAAYWADDQRLAETAAMTAIQTALRSGMTASTGLAIFFALGAAAEQRELYRLSVDLGRLGLKIATQYGGSLEKCRVEVLFQGLAAGYDNIHYASRLAQVEEGSKYGHTCGDRQYTAFAVNHAIMIRLFACHHLNELIVAAEEALGDIRLWLPEGGPVVLATALLNCVRALGGFTLARDVETVFDTENFTEKQFLLDLKSRGGDVPPAMNWYNAFKLVAWYCRGFIEEAAELGFEVYRTRINNPNHRHNRYALFFHSLALIDQLRRSDLDIYRREKYTKQVDLNQSYVRKWLSPSPINTGMWVALVDAELAALANGADAFKLYDVAVTLAMNHDWLMEEGWALWLQGCHFVRCGVDGLGNELQRRAISRHSQWGARGIVEHLSSVVHTRMDRPLKRSIFSADVAVQTDTGVMGFSPRAQSSYPTTVTESGDPGLEDGYNSLSAADLASILKWSQEVSRDINLSTALQRLTEIAIESSGALTGCVVLAREGADYSVVTSMTPPDACQTYDQHTPIRMLADPLQQAIIWLTLNSKEKVYYEDVSLDLRFTSEVAQSPYRSVISLPIFSNRGQTFGAVFLAAKYAFSLKTLAILTLLCQQVSVSIANALLFRSVQAGTRENLKMIASQKEALDQARKHREEAEKATKIKSTFLASMSHELRTPFSSFYGLLDILDSTELSPGQREIVTTAKQSCELLLKIIDSILDYSKLEASAVKLDQSGFLVENIIADCMELLLPMAARKLDLSFTIERDVPTWVKADYARIRQVLMNLIGNAVKFTASGSVTVSCTVDTSESAVIGEARLKFMIQDTGIGMSQSDVELLFTPFTQVDSSSTRKFGGTGLGLSISRQLVKLMGGAIGVQSWINSGSLFWFVIPVKIYEGDDSRKAVAEVESLKTQLLSPRPPRVLVSSTSAATRALLGNMLSGFFVTCVTTLEEARAYLQQTPPVHTSLDFIILDDQSEAHAEELARTVALAQDDALRTAQVVHLYTPTTDSLSSLVSFNSTVAGVTKITKPPRQARLLRTLADLKHLPGVAPAAVPTDVEKALKDLAAVRRTLFGNVLIAEDNPVAQKLLVKQLERHQLNVTATSNGQEAVNEWAAHDPGFFSVALFDHHMPVCDGVEAARQIRQLENERKIRTLIPIVALSADAQESTKQLCLSNGFNAFFSKPLKKSDLANLLSMFGASESSTDDTRV